MASARNGRKGEHMFSNFEKKYHDHLVSATKGIEKLVSTALLYVDGRLDGDVGDYIYNVLNFNANQPESGGYIATAWLCDVAKLEEKYNPVAIKRETVSFLRRWFTNRGNEKANRAGRIGAFEFLTSDLRKEGLVLGYEYDSESDEWTDVIVAERRAA